MSTTRSTTCELSELAGPAVDVAYDVSGRRMATCAATSSGACVIQVHECSSGPEAWAQVAAWETDFQVSQLAWAHPEFGRVLAGATAAGSVLVWGQVPDLGPGPGQAGAQGGGGAEDAGTGGGGGGSGSGGGGGCFYQLLAELVCGTSPCRSLCFAPRQAGLVLACLLEEGHVVVHEAEEVLLPRAWSLHSKIRAGPAGECRGLCWRPFTPGVPPMLCVGGGLQALVWQFVMALNSWQLVARAETGNGQPVSSVAWAPPLGRPSELLAAGAGRDLLLWSLAGDSAALAVSPLAAMEHEAPVWRVDWDLWGNQIAAATEGQSVFVYKPDLVGAWTRVAWVQGQPPPEEGSEGEGQE
ncbi:hypothetical protein HYH03_013535 [Edaphochlamys debaryana]|uniref:Uncharacterized protein n=1 Tax=Edaphochlamys debaryana TaxID=47281 RepID=A0A835XTI3_9CHLO|nr:hypothetical protein HYH03_013535 [Edaphochlamys debaryana]|eukprot:KAG2487956.1 hypothetical protein HYH03_013535 [Edaphochlamys debaryana]